MNDTALATIPAPIPPPTRPDEAFIRDAYVLCAQKGTRTPLNPTQYATQAAALFAVALLSEALPGVPLEIVSQYTGNQYYPVLQDTPEGPVRVNQRSIRIFGSETLHNAGLVFCYLLGGFRSTIIDEFRAEAPQLPAPALQLPAAAPQITDGRTN